MKQVKNQAVSSYLVKTFVLATLITLVFTSIAFAGNGGAISKKVYESALKTISNRFRQYSQVIPNNDKKSGVLEYENNYKYEKLSYFVDAEEVVETKDYDVTFDDGKYLVQTDNFKALYDQIGKKLFVKKMVKGKESGDTLYIENLSYMDDSYYEIEDYMDSLSAFVSSKSTSQRDYYELYAMAFDSIAKNLKDSYFSYGLVNGVHEFKLELNNDQAYELLNNVVRELVNDKKFCELAHRPDSYTDDDLEKDLADFKKAFDELKGMKFSIALYSKGLSFKFAGGKFEFNDGKSTVYSGELKLNDNSIVLDFDSQYETYSYDYSMLSSEGVTLNSIRKPIIKKSSLNFTVKSDDGKSFDKTSKIIASYVTDDGDDIESGELIIAGDSDKSLIESSRISLSISQGEERLDNLLVIKSSDDKALNKSSNIVIECNYEEEKDFKLANIISNDKKAVLDSSNLTIRIPELGDINIKLLDKKGLKDISKSSNLKINAKVKEYSVDIEYKANSEFSKAKKLSAKLIATDGHEEIKMELEASSKDNKPLKDSKQIKGFAKATSGKNLENVTFDSKEGFSYVKHSENSYSTTDTKMKLSFKKVNLDKMFNTKNAKKATDAEIMKVLDPTYKSYNYDDNDYDYDFFEDWINEGISELDQNDIVSENVEYTPVRVY